MNTASIALPRSLYAWPDVAFAATLQAELEALPAGSLPLDKASINGWHVDDSHITATVLRVRDETAAIAADVGIFFAEIIAGCSCGDAPQSQHSYCELRVCIDKDSGVATFAVPEAHP